MEQDHQAVTPTDQILPVLRFVVNESRTES